MWNFLIPAAGTLLGGIMGGKSQEKAANTAAGAQTEAARLGIEEQRRQFDQIRELLKPYTEAGTGAIGGYQNLMGLGGAEAQQQAIQGLANSPEMQALTQQGEEAILANASATGGLRGGNTQAALAQFRPQVLSSLINQQMSRFGGLMSLGQNAAAGVGNAGMQTGSNVAGLLGSQGAAQAGAALAGGRAQAGMWQGFGQALGMLPWDKIGAPQTPPTAPQAGGFGGQYGGGLSMGNVGLGGFGG